MTNIVSANGHGITADLAFNIGTPPPILAALCVDDGTTQFASGTLRQVIGTDGVANMDNRLFTILPTITGNTVTFGVLYDVANANFTHKRVGVTNAPASTTTTASGTFWGGVDGSGSLNLVKNNTFKVTYQFNVTLANGGTGNSLTADQGLQRIANRLFGINGQTGNTGKIASIGIDNFATAYANTDTSFGSGTVSAASKLFDSTPVRVGATVTCLATPSAANANIVIRRINLNDKTADVNLATAAITGLIGGVSNQNIALAGSFAPTITMTVTFS